jgi:hypothetical protein
MNGPPAALRHTQTAPSDNRAPHVPPEVLVRLFNGEPVCRVLVVTAEKLVSSGSAKSFRSGARRYLRLKPGVSITPTVRGWEVVEEARRQHGDRAIRRAFMALDRRPLRSWLLRQVSKSRLTESSGHEPQYVGLLQQKL